MISFSWLTSRVTISILDAASPQFCPSGVKWKGFPTPILTLASETRCRNRFAFVGPFLPFLIIFSFAFIFRWFDPKSSSWSYFLFSWVKLLPPSTPSLSSRIRAIYSMILRVGLIITYPKQSETGQFVPTGGCTRRTKYFTCFPPSFSCSMRVRVNIQFSPFLKFVKFRVFLKST